MELVDRLVDSLVDSLVETRYCPVNSSRYPWTAPLNSTFRVI
jgi:hypothetical protein